MYETRSMLYLYATMHESLQRCSRIEKSLSTFRKHYRKLSFLDDEEKKKALNYETYFDEDDLI